MPSLAPPSDRYRLRMTASAPAAPACQQAGLARGRSSRGNTPVQIMCVDIPFQVVSSGGSSGAAGPVGSGGSGCGGQARAGRAPGGGGGEQQGGPGDTLASLVIS
jgi:hypothetical protein